MDIDDKQTRSRMMSAVRVKDTRIKLLLPLRRGYCYYLHRDYLPGKLNAVIPKHRVVVFVNGCLWYYKRFRNTIVPPTRPFLWWKKIETNCKRGDAFKNTAEGQLVDGSILEGHIEEIRKAERSWAGRVGLE